MVSDPISPFAQYLMIKLITFKHGMQLLFSVILRWNSGAIVNYKTALADARAVCFLKPVTVVIIYSNCLHIHLA